MDTQTPGYFGIGIYQAKRAENVGVLWRGAYQLGAAFIFTIGQRYKPQSSDVFKTWLHLPFFSYATFDDMHRSSARDCPIIAVEFGGTPLPHYQHPDRAIYLLGAEDSGLPQSIIDRCHGLISIPAVRKASYNVAQAGTLVMYDRLIKQTG